MLAHGFVDTDNGDTFELDDTDPVTYGVVRLRGQPLTVAAVVALAALIIAVVTLIIIAT